MYSTSHALLKGSFDWGHWPFRGLFPAAVLPFQVQYHRLRGLQLEQHP